MSQTSQWLEMLDKFVEKNGRVPKFEDFTNENGLPSKNTINKYFGNIVTLLRQRYPQFYEDRWDANKIRTAVDKFVCENNRYPLMYDFTEKNNLPSKVEFEKQCGNIQDTLSEWYEDYIPRIHKWDKEKVVGAISEFVEKNNRLPKIYECSNYYKMPGYETIRMYCGDVKTFFEQYFPEFEPNRKTWTEETALEAIDRFIQEHQRLPRIKELNKDNGLPCYSALKRLFGDVFNFLNERYPQYKVEYDITHRKIVPKDFWNREKIIMAIDGFVVKNGRLPERDEFKKYNELPSFATLNRVCGSMKELYRERYPDYAGTRDARQRQCWDKKSITKAIENFVNNNHRLPTWNEFSSKYGLPSYSSINRYCGEPAEYIKNMYPDGIDNIDNEPEEDEGMGMTMW